MKNYYQYLYNTDIMIFTCLWLCKNRYCSVCSLHGLFMCWHCWVVEIEDFICYLNRSVVCGWSSVFDILSKCWTINTLGILSLCKLHHGQNNNESIYKGRLNGHHCHIFSCKSLYFKFYFPFLFRKTRKFWKVMNRLKNHKQSYLSLDLQVITTHLHLLPFRSLQPYCSITNCKL